MAEDMIELSAIAGFDYVKFQKRTPEVCVPEEQKTKPKDTPWGMMSYLEYKKAIEFGEIQYTRIDSLCERKKIKWFASVWDLPSAEFMKEFTNITKIPSAMVTNLELVEYCRKNFDKLIMSTGMSTEEEIEKAIKIGKPDVIMHTNSSYPSPMEDLNLGYLKWLRNKYPDKELGYSGHEFGLSTTFASITLGATWIERHITLDRMQWGSDHFASVEPIGVFKLVKGVRDIEKAIGKPEPRRVFDSEIEKRESLRGDMRSRHR